MINVEKTITDNPFVDNLIYYSKFLALNCNVKDEKEALSKETEETLKAGNVYIACIEKTARYEMFTSFPVEILEKYIEQTSNLDLLASSNDAITAYLNSFGLYERTAILNNLTKIAQTVYVDHYKIMTEYVKGLSDTWLEDNKELYTISKNGIATYKDLFESMPLYTRKRILVQYLNNYDNSDIDKISESLSEFEKYVKTRSDDLINTELENISKAMRNVFSSHYEIMEERGYVNKVTNNNWYDYIQFTEVYDKCINNTATYSELFDLFPEDDLKESLEIAIGKDTIDKYNFDSLDALDDYFDRISTNASKEKQDLNIDMRKKYIENYNHFTNMGIYNKCLYNKIDYYELTKYIPFETLKMIINTQLDEITNIQIYSENKTMLNSYLNTLPKEKRDEIKANITADMIIWYPNNYVEKNNYYRALIGLSPLDEDINLPFKDTLLATQTGWAVKDGKYERVTKSFGKKLINMIPTGIYPESHWYTPLDEFDNYDISILIDYGVLDAYVQECKSSLYSERYSYIRFLGDNKLDIYTCRKALNFQLIGLPAVDNSSVKNKFTDTYAINRDYVLRTVYSDAYEFQSDYYNKFIIIFILVNTIMDMLAGISKMLIDRDVFDYRCIKYLFESFGIPFYSEIPVKYQQAMLKNLNILIKYKSSTKNMVDICSLFGFSDIRVFGYYMLKERVVDSNTGEYIFEENNDISYDLDKLYVVDKANGNVIDINGVKYTKLLDYRNYDADKYLKKIYVEDDNGKVIEKTIINNKSKVFIMEKNDNSILVTRNNETGEYEEIIYTLPAPLEYGRSTTSYSFIPLTDTDYFKKIKADTKEADIKFIKVPIDDTLTDYKNDPDYISTYDDIVCLDKGNTWDGGLQHEDVKNAIIDYEFNAVLTKYISVETVTQMTELAFQVSYFYNMLFDNLYSEETLTVEIPFIRTGHKFKFMDVICYLFALMYYYNGVKDNIMYSPTQILYVKGYNFNDDLNTVLNDALAFTQKDSNGNDLKMEDKENIFDINQAIAETGYDYMDAFKDKRIKSFNLNVDIDALDQWLAQFQLSLDDFIVYNKEEALENGFNQVITLRNFYSLNNSYYQKNIFNDALLPTQYNNNIKYAFNIKLLKKETISDINKNEHDFVTEVLDINNETSLGTAEIINPFDDIIYVMDYKKYISGNNNSYVIYYKYNKIDNKYKSSDLNYYVLKNNEYISLLTGNIFVKDKDNNYVFSADNYYKLNDNNEYMEITDENNFYIDDNGRKIINFGAFYILKDGKYMLDPDNCYIKAIKNGKVVYILLKDADGYNQEIDANICYVLHSDGHFIPLVDTDFYRKQPDGSYEYDEEVCYIRTNTKTEYYDEDDNPRIYYEKLTDYYNENNYVMYKDEMFVKVSSDNGDKYISEKNLVNPNNCYYESDGEYYEVLYSMYTINYYKNPFSVDHIFVINYENNNYNRYNLINSEYVEDPDVRITYTKNSDNDYVIALINDATYEETKSMIVVLNKAISTKAKDEIIEKYNPEKTDKVWDENDWFYNDESFSEESVGINGENTWYYRKPGSTITPEEDDDKKTEVGSGFYLSAETYLGSNKLEKGSKYYMAMDVETNFSGIIQISCDADSECIDATCRTYNVLAGVKTHIAQIFTANDISSPRIKFLIYNFDEFPIEVGDYFVVSNIRFIKSYNDEYIAQDIPSYDKLQELYKTNEAIYKYLITMMQNCSDYDTYQIYKKLYDSLMTSEYNKEAFKLPDGTYAKTYTDFLQSRDPILYEKLTYFLSLDEESMHKEIADNIIEITYAIDDCVDTYSYGYLYSYFPAVSATYIQQYISKIIDFFKSWKVHLLGINTIYRFDSGLENTVRILEDQQYRNRLDNQADHMYIAHSAFTNPIDAKDPAGHLYSDKYPDLVKYSTYKDDTIRIDDRIKIISRNANMLKYTDNYENIHLVLNNEEVRAHVNSDGNLIVNDKSGLSVSIPNDLIYTTDEVDHDAYNQNISEINNDTIDII